MLDLRFIRKNPEVVKNNLVRRNSDKVPWVDDLLSYDSDWRKNVSEINTLRHERNQITDRIALFKREGKDVDANIREVEEISGSIMQLEEKVKESREKIDHILLRLPNIMHESVPFGLSEDDNVEIKRWGRIRKFGFKPKDHIDIATNLGMMDLERAAKVSGARFYYLKDQLVELNYALIKFGLDMLSKRGFMLIQPPYLLRKKALQGAVSLSDFEDMIYKVEGEDLYLIATSEHSILALHMNEILNGDSLPLKYCGVSPCFRREAGTHGRDTKGIFRVHQFEKVEQFVFCKPEESWREHEGLIANSEEFFKRLEIPYRIVNVCSGDLGIIAAKKYDLEAWLPGQDKYREVVSCSNCTTYQAVRSKIRYREKPNQPTEYVATLNSTLVATERALIAILENYQQEDGSVIVPQALKPYMNGRKKIERKE